MSESIKSDECPIINNAMLTAGHEEVLKLARSPELDVAKYCREDCTPLHFAAENGHDKIVEKLLAHGLINAQDSDLKTALYLAIERGHDPIVALLLAHEPSVAGLRDIRGETALHYAVKAGHTNIVAQLLAHSPATVHVVNKKQQSVLHFAVECGSVEIVELLLAANAAIDAVDQHKASALHRAVDRGCTELVELLLARKALVTDDRMCDPLIFRPVTDSHNEIVAMLLAHSPQLLDARTTLYGKNALHFASDPEIVQQLLSLNPTLLEESDRNGFSPLYIAVIDNRDKALAQMLAQCPGADVFGEDIPDVAFTTSNEQTLEVLLAHSPELIHVKLSAGMLLHYVLGRPISQAFVVKVWELNKQAVHVANRDYEETPFHIALQRDFDWAIEMMQGQLSFDEIVEACKRTHTSQDRFRPNVILELLSADVTDVVCEYLGFESRKRVGKRARDN